MGKIYLKEENGKKILYEKNDSPFPFGDKKIGELYERLDGSLETRNVTGENYILSEKRNFLDNLGDILPGVNHRTYEVTTSNGKRGIFEWNHSAKRYEFKEEQIKNENINSSTNNLSIKDYNSPNYTFDNDSRKEISQSRWHIVSWLYWGAVISFWLLFIYLSYTNHDPNVALKIIGNYLKLIWSPTNDPVLNFIIGTVIVVFVIVIGVGIIVSGFYLIIGFFVIGITVLILTWLASLSVTGAIIAALITIGIIIGIIKFFL